MKNKWRAWLVLACGLQTGAELQAQTQRFVDYTYSKAYRTEAYGKLIKTQQASLRKLGTASTPALAQARLELLTYLAAAGQLRAADSLQQLLAGFSIADFSPSEQVHWLVQRGRAYSLMTYHRRALTLLQQARDKATLFQLDAFAQAATQLELAQAAGRAGNYPLAYTAAQQALAQLLGLLTTATTVKGASRPAVDLHLQANLAAADALVQRGYFEAADSLLQAVVGDKNYRGLPNYAAAMANASLLLARSAALAQHIDVANSRYPIAVKQGRSAFGNRRAGSVAPCIYWAQLLAQQQDSKQLTPLRQQLEQALQHLQKKAAPGFAEQALHYSRFASQEGNPVQGRAYAHQALVALKKLQDTTSCRVSEAYEALALADGVDSRYTIAELYQQQALTMLDSLAGTHNVRYVQAQAAYANLQAAHYQFGLANLAFTAALEENKLQRLETHPASIELRLAYATALARANQFALAQTQLQLVLRLQRSLYGSQSIEAARTQDKLGKLALDQSDYNAAETALTEALRLLDAQTWPYTQDRILTYNHLALLYQGQGEFKKAEDYYLQALKLSQLVGGATAGASSTAQLAELYQNTGRYNEALVLLTQTVTLYEKTKRQDDEYVTALNSLALLYLKMGRYPEAEQTARKARALVQQLMGERSLNYANAQVLLAKVVTEMGRFKEAETYLDDALVAYKQFYTTANLNTAKVTALLGMNYYQQGKTAAAMELLQTALQQVEQATGPTSLDYATLQAQQAQLYLAQGNLQLAERLFLATLSIQKDKLGLKHPDYLRTEGQLATLFKYAKRYRESESTYKYLLRYWKQQLGERHPDYALYLADYADLLWLSGSTAGASKQYQKALRLLLNQVDSYFPGLSEQEKADFWAKLSTKLDRYFLFATTEGAQHPVLLGQAYNLRLRTKALLLNQGVALRSRILSSNDEQLKQLFAQWQAKREGLAKLYTLSRAQLKQAGVDIAAEERAVSDLEKQLSLRSDIFSKKNRQEQPTWQAVAKSLPAGAAAVEIIRIRAGLQNPTDSIVYRALILKDSLAKAPLLVQLDNGKLLERRYYLAYVRALTNRFEDKDSYTHYWAPLEGPLADRLSVYLSADGVYNQLSLSSLRLPTGGYLLDKRNVHYLSNTKQLLARLSQNSFEGRLAVLMGNPAYNEGNQGSYQIPELKGTQQEVDEVNTVLTTGGWRTQEYLRTEANEPNMLATANPKLLHIATHGFFYPVVEGDAATSIAGIDGAKAAENPLLRAGLLLSGSASSLSGDTTQQQNATATTGTKDNGIVTAYEVMNMNLDNTQLVVLSACETGLGEVRNGEGVYGLQRAFELAGAHTVLMSLWRVNDEVTEQMISRFYKNWIQRKMSPYQAFHEAQLEIRQQYEQPYYWGAFVMVGE